MSKIRIPLADRVRPRSLDEFVGQNHILGEGKILSGLIKSQKLISMIFWGPPGCGKTTLAKIIGKLFHTDFYKLSAVSAGVKEVREIITKAEINYQHGKNTILFIDEIHRFNKTQQDSLLHSIENGTLILIGATTENPSFEIIPPLLSRCKVFVLEPLIDEDLKQIIYNSLERDDYLKSIKIEYFDIDYLVSKSNADARVCLNSLEIAIELAKLKSDKIVLDKEILSEALQKRMVDYDKLGEEHYNLISAFIKSIRGSDPDAAVYYLARMLEGGEDPLFIARRMIILAAEDIGNASPNALVIATSTFHACHFVGMPETRIILSQCTIYLASQPKSNASYIAIEKAIEDVRNLPNYSVPLHLRNAPTSLMKQLDYGKDYKYVHDYTEHFSQGNYLPTGLKNKQYYVPTDQGYEKTLKERLSQLWKGKKKY